jgi:hypothetical protein
LSFRFICTVVGFRLSLFRLLNAIKRPLRVSALGQSFVNVLLFCRSIIRVGDDSVCPVVQGLDNTQFVLDGVVRREVQILVRMCGFTVYLDVKISVRFDYR